MSGAALEVSGVSRRFSGLLAVDDVSFSVQPGEVVGLIGPNGAGKSTLFEVISGNIPATSGRVALFGEDVTARSAFRRRRAGLSRTFQKVHLFGSLTVAENIAVAASQCATARSVADEVRLVLDKLRLTRQADLYPREITLADRKKVEIGRAIAGLCRVLLLDESLCGLTPSEADELVDEILGLNRREGLTIVLVEHVMPIVTAMASRLIVLQQGRVIADGLPSSIASNPIVIEAYLGKTRLGVVPNPSVVPTPGIVANPAERPT